MDAGAPAWERQFLSTPSARRATAALSRRFRGLMISIHALREEGDIVTDVQEKTNGLFLSTPSARRATTIIPLWIATM